MRLSPCPAPQRYTWRHSALLQECPYRAPPFSFMTRPAARKRAGVSCCPGPAKAKVVKDNVNKAIAYFFIRHSPFIPRYFADELVKGDIRGKDQAVRRPLIRLKIRTTTAMTSKRWIRAPPTWKLKPSSHRIKRITRTVHSMCSSSGRL